MQMTWRELKKDYKKTLIKALRVDGHNWTTERYGSMCDGTVSIQYNSPIYEGEIQFHVMGNVATVSYKGIGKFNYRILPFTELSREVKLMITILSITQEENFMKTLRERLQNLYIK